MSSESFAIDVRWRPRQESTEQCAARLAKTLEGLAALHPALASWQKKGMSRASAKRAFCTMPPRLDELTRIFERGRQYTDMPREPWPELGYSITAWNGRQSPCDLGFVIRAGIYSLGYPIYPNDVELELSGRQPGNEDLIDVNILQPALALVMAAWEADWGAVVSRQYLATVESPEGKRPTVVNGWMACLSATLARMVTPPPQAIVERLEDGGLMLLSTRAPFSSDNPAHLAAAHAIQAALAPLEAIARERDAQARAWINSRALGRPRS